MYHGVCIDSLVVRLFFLSAGPSPFGNCEGDSTNNTNPSSRGKAIHPTQVDEHEEIQNTDDDGEEVCAQVKTVTAMPVPIPETEDPFPPPRMHIDGDSSLYGEKMLTRLRSPSLDYFHVFLSLAGACVFCFKND